MAFKRKRMDKLTGGTGDVNPQSLKFSVLETAANTFTQSTIPIPVLRSSIGSRVYQVIEVLKINIIPGAGTGADGDIVDIQITYATAAAMLAMSNADVLFRFRHQTEFTTSGSSHTIWPFMQDLTDGAGHGRIVATQDLFVGIVGTSQGAAVRVDGEIIYRFKNVGVDEFIGLAIQQG